ncbi:endonuclease III [candidate division KSB1 bacterium]|nr:endonuclease III [candidate division KSB1 bacterium]MBL7095900.1 endonuclease III [candidate division KSB1 bacterium]
MDLKEKAKQIMQALENKFGIPKRENVIDPLSNLVLTVLSQSTNDKNRDTAYNQLRELFPTWEDVMNGNVKKIADAIRPGGLANQKSERIKNILKWIHQEYGSLNLDNLCDMEPDQTIEKFTQLKGVGVKTISVVMMFSCGIDIFPVDTHVHRICRRMGFVPDKASAEKTFWEMRPLVPKEKSFSLHMNFLKLGRTICYARKPRCEICPLNKLCDKDAAHLLKPSDSKIN